MNNNSITLDYLQYHDLYKKKYGDKVFVLMQVGSFFEGYATKTRGPNLQQIANILNIICSKKDKSIPEVNEKNPYMMGFPLISSEKFINLLVSNSYTVVVIEQVTPPPNPERKVTNIFSSGTYIDNIESADENFIVCVYLQEEKQRNGSYLLCSGMSAISISTGKTYIHEALSAESDNRFALDETNRFINSLHPSELIIFCENTNTDMISLLETNNIKPLIINKLSNNKYREIKFQNEFFGKIYQSKVSGMISPIEMLELERTEYTRMSFMLLLDFVKDHSEDILNDINIPEDYIDTSRLILGNNAIYQLNVISDVNINSAKKESNNIDSLFSVVNNTSTAMGYRLLKDRLVSPFISVNDIEKIYTQTELFLSEKFYNNIEENLSSISDIERLYRKMLLLRLAPYELVNLVDSCNESIKVYHKLVIKLEKHKVLIKLENHKDKFILRKETVDKINGFIKKIEKLYMMNELKKYSLNNISDTFFAQGIHKDIDKIRDKLKNELEFYEELCAVLSDYMGDNRKTSTLITVKKNDRNGYYLTMSKNRTEILKKNLEDIESITIKGKEVFIKDFVYDMNNKSNSKLSIPSLFNNNNNNNNDDTDDDENQNKKISELTYKYYIESLRELCIEYGTTIKELVPFIANVDFVKSNAKTSTKYNYTKPIISYDPLKSFIKAEKLRHPIIERLIDYEYIPHNVDIGTDLKGMLTYGSNGVGKSSYMKSIGLSIIMAQAGLYVPAEKYIYSPYNMLFTRITGNDNLFKGMSSFTVEMVELKTIMKRSGPRTMVIGDEVCRGTEHISGNAIVASTIIKLAKSGSSFIFATHLHELASMKRITELGVVKSFHISVDFDVKTQSLIYSRHLLPGPGEPIYGITVAKHIIQDTEFIKLATEIKNELLNNYDGVTSGKVSRYNSDLLVDECKLCGKTNKKLHISPLETHHILFQKDCTEEGFNKQKPHIKKNDLANLVVLCSECHDKLHNNEFSIDGYVMTSKGRSLKIKKDNQLFLN